MNTIILHYQVIQDKQKCSNNTIRKKKIDLKLNPDLCCKNNQTTQKGQSDLRCKNNQKLKRSQKEHKKGK